jgi:hypothetical protein
MPLNWMQKTEKGPISSFIMLKRIPPSLKQAETVHFHGGRNNAELRACLKLWFDRVSALLPLNPPRKDSPPASDIAIMAPRCEIAPVVLATYLLSEVPFAILMPVDLLDVARKPDIFPDALPADIAQRFDAAGKVTILEAQMTWVIGNL